MPHKTRLTSIAKSANRKLEVYIYSALHPQLPHHDPREGGNEVTTKSPTRAALLLPRVTYAAVETHEREIQAAVFIMFCKVGEDTGLGCKGCYDC